MKTLKTFEFKTFGSRNGQSYDWDLLLDGRIHEMTSGEDYKCKDNTFKHLAFKQAKAKGLKLRTAKVEGGVVIQAVPGDGEASTMPTEPKAEKGKGKGK